MKKLVLIIMISTSFFGLSQGTYDVITLKNGSVIVGEITELNFNQDLTVQTKDGYGFMFRAQDIKSIKKEQHTRAQQQDEQFKMVMPSNTISNQNPNQIHSQNNPPGSSYTGQSSQTPNYGGTNVSPTPSNLAQNRYFTASTPQLQQNYQQTIPNNNQNYNVQPHNNLPQKSYQDASPQHINNQHGNINRPNTANTIQYSNQATAGYQNPQQQLQNYQNPTAQYASQYNRQASVTPNYTNPNMATAANNSPPAHQIAPSGTRTISPNQGVYQPNSNQAINMYTTPNQNQAGIAYQANTTPASPILEAKQTANPDIFTDINTLGKVNNTAPKINCMEGYGNFCFVNNTSKNVLVSLQKKQRDGYYGDYKEIAIAPNSKGYFNNIKVNDYPFFVKIKNSVQNQNNYVILGRGNIRVQQCKTEYITINY